MSKSINYIEFAKSIVCDTDAYKVSMRDQYPEGTEIVHSYIESRGGVYDKIVFFGTQMYICDMLTKRITKKVIEFAKKFWEARGEPFNYDDWMYIVKKHKGKLPIIIRAVDEGSIVSQKQVLVSIENTDPKCWWLTTWIETSLLRAIWYPTTVASKSYQIKELIASYYKKAVDVQDINAAIQFALNDFGSRGVSSNESARIGGLAHLVNFSGSDTSIAALQAMQYYDAGMAETAFSIVAAEHSTITSWLRENEIKAYENMVEKFGSRGIFAVVSDSYDIYQATQMWGTLKDKILAKGCTVVIRPDSGDPCEVLPKMLSILEKDWGVTRNSKGYKVLNTVRLIWGDGIEYQQIDAILRMVTDVMGYSPENICFGMGGALLQKMDRDTNKWAMKCSSARVNGIWRDVFKDPITDKGKKSKVGRFLDMPIRFENGELVNQTTFAEVRQRAASEI